MKKILILSFFFIISHLFSQNKEVTKLIAIENKYDSILIDYQKRTKDSLANFSQEEINKIMSKKENEIFDEKLKLELIQLNEIKISEQEKISKNEPLQQYKCEKDNVQVLMPDIKFKKYKPTYYTEETKPKKAKKESVESVVTFVVTGNGYIENVNAVGENMDFNKALEITLYEIEKMTVRCENGEGIRMRYRMPVKMIFNN